MELDSQLRLNLFERLYWSIRAPAHEIEIATEPSDQATNIHAQYLPNTYPATTSNYHHQYPLHKSDLAMSSIFIQKHYDAGYTIAHE